ncbi:unnamed protein product [Lactuca virosa]|uniref:Uncharacterized protein n=1 Tax=Lactuca virosa TaxID=75947 RepID=A0AAU9N693_9ASTR|nr:unnamed protein product [Lactuca virosa]
MKRRTQIKTWSARGEDYGHLSDGLSLLGFFKGSTLSAFLVGGPLGCGFVGCSERVSNFVASGWWDSFHVATN